MSEVKHTGYKKMKCGDMHHNASIVKAVISDTSGAGFVNLQVVGTDVNVSGAVVGATLVTDYSPGVDANGDSCANPDGTFMITIETSGAQYFVTLFDGSDFIITPTQATAYLGQWYPARLLSVNVGTTGDFCVGY